MEPGAVCVVGQEASGAAVVARLLQEHGLWLGEPETLVAQTYDESDAKGALEAIASTAAGRPWGWRHVGNPTTLPSWCRLVAPLKAVVCVRNEVRSETVPFSGDRDPSRRSHEEILRRLLPPWQIIVTHYESWFAAPHRELERVGSFLGLALSERNAEPGRFIRPLPAAKDPLDILPWSTAAFLKGSSSVESRERQPWSQRKAA
jgi:hypothetical protein